MKNKKNKKRVVLAGQKYQEYKEGSAPFKIVKVSGKKVHTSRGTIINKDRLIGTKHYKLLSR